MPARIQAHARVDSEPDLHFVSEKDSEQVLPRVSQCHSDDSSQKGEHHAFPVNSLTNDSRSTRSHSQTHSDFVVSSCRSGKQQIGHTQANDEEEETEDHGEIGDQVRNITAPYVEAAASRFNH